MIKIGDTIIQASTEEILQTLKLDLFSKDIERFHVFKPNGDNIQTNCPFHKDGKERKPSFGINGELNKCHCFTCGWSGGIENMISELYGKYDDGKYGKKWLIRRFNTLEIETRKNILGDSLKRVKSKNTRSQEYIKEEELDTYRYYHDYMYKRGLTDEIIERFDIGYDRKRNCLTFPIKDINGNCVFVATRSVNTKFFGLPQGQNKPIYQAYRFRGGEYKKAYICESFLNCLTYWKYNRPAMAMIGTGNKEQYKILEKLPVREYVLSFDNDEAGRKAVKRFKQNVKGKIIKEVIYNSFGEDINDLQEKCLELEEKFL